MIIPIELVQAQNIKYDIVIDDLPQLTFDTKVVIVTNPTVAGYHLDMLLDRISARELHVVRIPDGEEYKNS